MSFHEYMCDYLMGPTLEEEHIIREIEAKFTGFRERLNRYSTAYYVYRENDSDIMLLSLLREEHAISEIVENHRIEKFRKLVQRADSKKFQWADED
jgi:hypothetical protein